MNAKNIFKIILAVAVIAIAVFSWWAYQTYFMGAWPAILPPIAVSPFPSSSVIPSSSPLPSIAIPQNTTGMPLSLPPGFSISFFAKGLTDARVIVYDPDGNLLVSETSQGNVVALPDKNADGVADEMIVVASGLNRPHGLAFHCEGAAGAEVCKLYIAESDQVAVYDYDQSTMKAINKKKVADLSNGGEHFTRTLGFGPDGRLYVSIGSDCNVCLESDNKRAKVFSMNPDGSDFKEFASGLRNTVFFTWNPMTNEMWGADMGRDFLGDNLPPDEINILKEGGNYGWPTCYGKNIHDTVFDKNTYIRNPCMEPFETPSYIDIPAHSAPLGLAFVPANSSWPQDYWYNLFVAYHGSWNRTVPAGYKVVRYKLEANGNVLGTEDFITGWLKPGDGAYGRPVDIIVLPGGSMYISDDKAGVIYRVVYNGK